VHGTTHVGLTICNWRWSYLTAAVPRHASSGFQDFGLGAASQPPAGPSQRGELLSWLMFAATGVGPYCGQAVYFRHFAPEKVPYAQQRYAFEARRHFEILNERLAGRRYMLGDVYTIVDVDVWGWGRMVPFVLGDDAWATLPHLKRLVDEISARPAAVRAVALKEQFAFKAEMDDEARKQHVPASDTRCRLTGCTSARGSSLICGGLDCRCRRAMRGNPL
jgi:hypothetical protein